MTMDRPPLRWIGGKQRYASTIVAYLDRFSLEDGRYFEPFLGGASVFLSLNPPRAVLSDANLDLMLFYRYLAEFPAELWAAINKYADNVTPSAYMDARTEFNSTNDEFRRAVLFLVLNRTGFNGVWRVNRKGHYNVPFGHRGLALCEREDWMALSAKLSRAELTSGDYLKALATVENGDVVYLDPPYFDSTGHEMFARYTHSGFSRADHERLAEEMVRLSTIGAKVVITVRDDPFIRDLYGKYGKDIARVSSCVGARTKHAKVFDLIIYN